MPKHHSKQIPAPVIEEAKPFIEMFGEKVYFLGEHNGAEFYGFRFPKEELGFPVVFQYQSNTVQTISGFEVFDIFKLFHK